MAVCRVSRWGAWPRLRSVGRAGILGRRRPCRSNIRAPENRLVLTAHLTRGLVASFSNGTLRPNVHATKTCSDGLILMYPGPG